jgi:hypothetical protein
MNRIVLALGVASVVVLVFMTSAWVTTMEKGEEQKKPDVGLELIWEREFEEGIVDVAFDKQRQGLFCPTMVIAGKSSLDCSALYFLNKKGSISSTRWLKRWAAARISVNGLYVGIMEAVEVDEKGSGFGRVEIIDAEGRSAWTGPLIGYGNAFWVSPRGNGIAALDEKTEEWKVHYGNECREFRTPGGSLTESARLNDQTKVLDDKVRLYLWPGEELRHILSAHAEIGTILRSALSNDGLWAAFIVGDSLLVWDAKRTMFHSIRGTSGIPIISFSPDGHRLAVGSTILGREHTHESVMLVNSSSGECLWRSDNSFARDKDRGLAAIDVANGAEYIVVARRMREIHVLDAKGTTLGSIALHDGTPIINAKVSPDGQMLCVVTKGEHHAKSGTSVPGGVYVFRIVSM